MSDTTLTPAHPRNDRSCTGPLRTMLQACLAWYRRRKTPPENHSSRPNSDSTLTPNSEIDEFSVKMGSMPVDYASVKQAQTQPQQRHRPLLISTSESSEAPEIFCKYSSEYDRRKWGELQPQLVPDAMVLERIKAAPINHLPLRAGLAVSARG